MRETDLMRLVGVPIGLGLLGFVEPCSIGSTLLFIKSHWSRKAVEARAEMLRHRAR